MVEDNQEGFIIRREQVGEKPIQGKRGIGDPLAVHTLADIKQDPEADWNPTALELRDRLRPSILEYLEIIKREVASQSAVAVSDRGGNQDQVYAGSKDLGPGAISRPEENNNQQGQGSTAADSCHDPPG
jgi:hypothetical protein